MATRNNGKVRTVINDVTMSAAKREMRRRSGVEIGNNHDVRPFSNVPNDVLAKLANGNKRTFTVKEWTNKRGENVTLKVRIRR